MIEDFNVEISQYFKDEAKTVAAVSGKELINLHQLPGVTMIEEDNLEQVYLNGTWRPSLTVTGVDGLPPTKSAGNVIRSKTTAKISIRLPPTLSSEKAVEIVKEKLLVDAPYGAKVEIGNFHAGDGWSAGELPTWLRKSLDDSSEGIFGPNNSCKSYGIGGSIPFLATLGGIYPETEILAVGVGSIESNAHNPNEFIVLPYAKNLIKSISHVLVDCGK
jgi:acetylornithine deacetylase/succinyl-diaminopimelate desuccinylase-like protein